MRRVLSLGLVVLAACGTGSASEIPDADEVAEMLSAVALSPRTVQVVTTTPIGVAEIHADVADDQLWSATLQLDSRLALEETVVDDARYLRPHAEIPGLAPNQWSYDPDGALGWGEKTPRPSPFDPRRILSRIRFTEGLVPDLAVGRTLKPWNPDASDYLPTEDKFGSHKDFGMRFDMLPPQWDPTLLAVSFDAVKKYFTWISIWVHDGAVTRVERLIELPNPKDAAWNSMYSQLTKSAATVDDTGLIPPIPPKLLRGLELHEVFTIEFGDVSVSAPTNPIENRWTQGGGSNQI